MNNVRELTEIKPELSGEQIQTYLFNLNLFNQDNIVNNLTEEECQRAGKLKINEKRKQFVITRGILRQLLSNILDKKIKEINILYEQHCKPYVNDKYKDNSLEFNVSHSGEYALIAITLNNKIGVDIEKINPDIDYLSLSQRFFSDEEKALFTNLNKTEQLDAFYSLWTKKESFIKATGKGIAFGLNRFSISLKNNPGKVELQSSDIKNEWYSHNIFAPDGYKSALTVSSKDVEILIADFTD